MAHIVLQISIIILFKGSQREKKFLIKVATFFLQQLLSEGFLIWRDYLQIHIFLVEPSSWHLDFLNLFLSIFYLMYFYVIIHKIVI